MGSVAYTTSFLDALHLELQKCTDIQRTPHTKKLQHMVHYALDLDRHLDGDQGQGKRFRPLLLLLIAQTVGDSWQRALSAAAAIELLHNFTLVHDDIEDHSPFRRGRPSLWKHFGVPHAINAGDLIFTLAYRALDRLEQNVAGDIMEQARKRFHATCLQLTTGQFLDLEYAGSDTYALDVYWQMVQGKTGALIACACRLGALIGGAPKDIQIAYEDFGMQLGMAYQAQDDVLGIWGNEANTGKPTGEDILSRKKTLPIVYAFSEHPGIRDRWLIDAPSATLKDQLAHELEALGARNYSMKVAREHFTLARTALERAAPTGHAARMLFGLLKQLAAEGP